jgi:RP/EB family microtubule-associated protein
VLSLIVDAAKTETPKADPQMEKKIQELQHTIAELKLTVDGLEKERDFYFGKLREIELLVQAEETQDTINKKSIQDIL